MSFDSRGTTLRYWLQSHLAGAPGLDAFAAAAIAREDVAALREKVEVGVADDVDLALFLQHVAITIVVALLASLVIAQTLIPMLAARVAPPPAQSEGSLMGRLTERYTRFIRWSMELRGWRRLYIEQPTETSRTVRGVGARASSTVSSARSSSCETSFRKA